MGRPRACNCRCRPTKFYRNDVSASIPSSTFANINAKFAGVTNLLPTSSAQLNDCNVYLINAWGATKEFPPTGGYDVWNLSSTHATILAAWVASGGKLICCVDYKQLLTGSASLVGSATSTAYGASLNALLAAAGSGLSVTPTNATSTTPSAWPTSTFISTSLTTGITGPVAHDWDGGSPISGGTLCFNPNSANQIRFETVGSGLVVLFGSRNTMWGDPATSFPPPPSWAAMSDFLQRVIDL